MLVLGVAPPGVTSLCGSHAKQARHSNFYSLGLGRPKMLGFLILHGFVVILLAVFCWRWLGDDLVIDFGSWALFSEFVFFIVCVGYVAGSGAVFILDLGVIQTVVPALSISCLFCFDEVSGLFMGILILALTVCYYFLVDYFEYDVHGGSIFLLSFLFSQLAILYFSSFDLFTILFLWEAISLVSFFLIHYWSHRLSSFKAGLKVLVISHLGDVPFFLFFFILWGRFQTTALVELLPLLPLTSFEYFLVGPCLLNFNVCAAWLLAGAVFLKSAQFVFYPWLLDAMEAPVPISAQLHSSTLVIIGFYLYFRFLSLFLSLPSVGVLFIFVGLTTALGASFLGFFQEDGKRLLACSTAGQLGYVVIALGLGAHEEALLLLVFSCVNKAFTFVWFGTLMQRYAGVSDFRFIAGAPVVSWAEHAGLCVALANFTVFPGAFSWHVKGLFLRGYPSHYPVFTAAALDVLQLTWFLSSLYMFRLYFALFFRSLSSFSSPSSRGSGFSFFSSVALNQPALSLFNYSTQSRLSLPFLVISIFVFTCLSFMVGFFGLPGAETSWVDAPLYHGVCSYF